MTNNITDASPRDQLIERLRQQWVGPAEGENEELMRSPVYAYLVGTLYPVEIGTVPPTAELEEPVSVDVELEADLAQVFDGDGNEFTVDDESGDEDPGLNLTGAFGWAPQSLGMSFIHDGTGILASVRAGAYSKHVRLPTQRDEETTEAEARDADSAAVAPDSWKRERADEPDILLPNTPHGSLPILNGRATIAWRSRIVGDRRLTTVAISNSATVESGRAKADPSLCLFQVSLECRVRAGVLHPYPTGNPVSASREDRELELRYRDKLSFGIGHGAAVTWDTTSANPNTILSDALPRQEVAAIRPRKGAGLELELRWLADESVATATLAEHLRTFAEAYTGWLGEQESTARGLDSRFADSAESILERIRTATERIEEGIRLLEQGGTILTSFRLANAAMREQMLQQGWSSDHPGHTDQPLSVRGPQPEPEWRPFQLGFILLSLSSTVESDHDDRDLVDLIWFPTGGGKTEAYLGLAAIEMIRRRLDHGISGGGTTVITRYTMRLLTAQQFQRASTLICALELLRIRDDRLRRSPSFSIGLWLGNTTTPATYKKASADMKYAYKDAVPENTFQLRECPWCGTTIFPSRRTAKVERYGVRASNYDFAFFCPHADCPFHDFLPVNVVDEAIFQNPPTMLVATVDKFARLAWLEHGLRALG